MSIILNAEGITMAGRPREFDADAALVRARDLFWEHGYEGVSMSDLVKALGIASARIYAAFSSKEDLFRQAVQLYEEGEGGFADKALNAELPIFDAVAQMFLSAIELYTKKRKRRPLGCMVVSSAANCTPQNEAIGKWLQEHRRQRTSSIIRRFEKAVEIGELPEGTNPKILGDLCATILHGISVQARDGVPKVRLLAGIETQVSLLRSYSESISSR
jgi:AcrR family transcriptional regulator